MLVKYKQLFRRKLIRIGLFGFLLMVPIIVLLAVGTGQSVIKQESKRLGGIAFDRLYVAMQQGWDRDTIDQLLVRLNELGEGTQFNVVRSEAISTQFGDRPQSPMVTALASRVFSHDGSVIETHLSEGVVLDGLPIRFEQACLGCHLEARAGDIAGVIVVETPLRDVRVPLYALFPLSLVMLVLVLLLVDLMVYRVSMRELIHPLEQLAKRIRQISNHGDLDSPLQSSSSIHELKTIEHAFNQQAERLRDSYSRSERHATLDELTGLHNRRSMVRAVEYELKRCERYQRTFSLILADLNRFKPINDRYGHAVGDEALKRVSRVMENSLRSTDSVYRLGGDEFVILLPETQAAGAQALFEEIRQQLQISPLRCGDDEIVISTARGVAEFPRDGDSLDELIAMADQRMYEDKTTARE